MNSTITIPPQGKPSIPMTLPHGLRGIPTTLYGLQGPGSTIYIIYELPDLGYPMGPQGTLYQPNSQPCFK